MRALLFVGIWATRAASMALWPIAWLHQELSNAHVAMWNHRFDMQREQTDLREIHGGGPT